MRSVLEYLSQAITYLFGFMIISITIAAISPQFGLVFAWLAVAVTLIALIKPIESIGLGHRGVAAATLVLALIILATITQTANDATEKHLATLEKENPAQYLVELKEYDREKWMTALKRLDPKLYQLEMKQIRREKVAERAREKTRLAADEAEQNEERCRSRYARIFAYNTAQEYVAAQLKAPSTAEFPNSSKATISPFGECSFKINGYVDAQNGFGAMIRSRYVAEITRDGEYSWRFGGVQFL